MRLKHLFPIEVETEIPPLDESADCKFYCIGSDSNRYAVKQVTDNRHYPSAPFDELFAYEIAQRVGIAVPQYNLIKVPGATNLGFGSAWEGSVVKDGFRQLMARYQAKVPVQVLDKDLFLKKASAIYALDLFLCNEDRHFGNYMIKDLGATAVIMAMDFGRSWTGLRCPVDHDGQLSPIRDRLPIYYLRQPEARLKISKCIRPNAPIFAQKPRVNFKKTNTFGVASLIWDRKCLGPIHGGAFFDVLAKIEQMTVQDIQYILNEAPDGWCSPARKQGIEQWWGSSERIKRLNKIKAGYQNGTLV